MRDALDSAYAGNTCGKRITPSEAENCEKASAFVHVVVGIYRRRSCCFILTLFDRHNLLYFMDARPSLDQTNLGWKNTIDRAAIKY